MLLAHKYQKYQRQIQLKGFGLAGQDKLLETKILVIGAGGLGCLWKNEVLLPPKLFLSFFYSYIVLFLIGIRDVLRNSLMKKTKQKKSRTKSNPAFLAQTLLLSSQKHGSLISFTPAASLITEVPQKAI